MQFPIIGLISWLRTYTIIRRDSIAGYNLALNAARDALNERTVRLEEARERLASVEMAHSATMQTLADTKNKIATAESAKFVAEQQAEQARARLKEANQYAAGLEQASEKAEADAQTARAAEQAANAEIEAAIKLLSDD